MNLWQVIDMLAIGWRSVAIEGSFSLEQTSQRINALTEEPHEETETPRLMALVEKNAVTVWYEEQRATRVTMMRGSNYRLPRCVFRGFLADVAGCARLTGTFGVSWAMRILGFVVALQVAAYIAFWAAGRPSDWDLSGLIGPLLALPVIFVGLSLVARISAADDVPLILRNLQYALRGDE